METLTQTLNYIGLIYVALPLVLLLIGLIYYLFGKRISPEGINKIIEFAKWYMVSIALVFSAKIIESGFTERETGMKEMQVYDKYVEHILKADNIEARWRLTEYFAAVTPTERLRQRWLDYKDIIRNDYLEFMKLKDSMILLKARTNLSAKEQSQLVMMQRSMAPFERKLINPGSGRWVIVIPGDNMLQNSEKLLNELMNNGIDNPRILFRDNSYKVISRTFNSMEEADSYLNLYREKVRRNVYIENLDRWCPRETFNGKYYICE